MTNKEKADTLDKVALLFLFVPIVAFVVAAVYQYSKLKVSTFRIQVLSTRLSLLLPFYALFVYLCVAAPSAYPALEILIAVVESSSFYTFFALIVSNLGGPDKAIAILTSMNKKALCCGCCCPATVASFYNRVQWALFHFMTTRVVVVIIATILTYRSSTIGSVIATLVSAGFVVNAFLTLILFCE